jgi:hypothetical protein
MKITLPSALKLICRASQDHDALARSRPAELDARDRLHARREVHKVGEVGVVLDGLTGF